MFDMIGRQIKIFLKSPELLFWSTVFPLILAVFFQLALGNVGRDTIGTMRIAYLNTTDTSVTEVDKILRGINQTSDVPLFEVVDTTSNEEALSLLNTTDDAKRVVALIDFKQPQLSVTIKQEGISQLVVTQVVNAINQNTTMIGNMAKINPQMDIQAVVDTLGQENEYFTPNSDKDSDFIVVYFYSLIGMQCMYGYMWGLSVINQNEANQSIKGQRVQVSPVTKSKLIISGVIASLLVHYASVLLLIAFLYFGLQVSFGSNWGYILLIGLIGSLAGVTMGTFIGSASKASLDVKVGMGIGASMLMSSMAGMMFANLKLIIQQKAPYLAYINPVTQVSDGLNSLYYYDSLDRYWMSIAALVVFALVMIGLSVTFSRRKQYDSI